MGLVFISCQLCLDQIKKNITTSELVNKLQEKEDRKVVQPLQRQVDENKSIELLLQVEPNGELVRDINFNVIFNYFKEKKKVITNYKSTIGVITFYNTP